MRALRAERLTMSSQPARHKGKARKAAAKPAKPAKPGAGRRRKPPPRWLRPLIWGGCALALVLLLAGGAWWLWHDGYARAALNRVQQAGERAQVAAGLTVDEVILWGRRQTPRDAILRALAVRRGEPILEVDLDAAQARLAAIGWVRSATVARRLPSLLEVTIVERTPLALWQRSGRLVVVGNDGAVITERGLERFRELPIIVGGDAPAHAAALFAVLRRDPELFRQVEAAVRVGARRWNLRFRGGVEVRLPEGGEAEAWMRLAALERRHRILGRDLVAIDMRLPDRLIVRLAPDSAKRFHDPGEKT